MNKETYLELRRSDHNLEIIYMYFIQKMPTYTKSIEQFLAEYSMWVQHITKGNPFESQNLNSENLRLAIDYFDIKFNVIITTYENIKTKVTKLIRID